MHIRPFIGAREFINGEARYCLWLKGVAPSQYFYPEIQERLRAVSEMRKKSPTASVQESASTPALFTQIRQPETDYLLVPQVSSERRKYIPIGYVKPETIVSNAAYIIPDASLYDFGLLCSQFHNAWMRIVAGRLKSDYRYSPAVYNSFVFPNASAAQKAEIERLANEILKVRAAYEGVSLAQLYDPEKMPFDLLAAHEALDAAVEQAYGVDFGGDEEKIVSHLFTLYAQATS